VSDTPKTGTPHPGPALRLVSGAKQEPLRCPAAGRDAESEKTLCFYFNRRMTDDEMRHQSWPRLSEQQFRVDKWSFCQS
jgi:hypothetical protein